MNTLFSYTSVTPIAAPKKKWSFLPILTVLFLFSYGLMTFLIVEQGSVIQSQRNLIKVLLRDSTELWAAKGKALGDQQMAQAQSQSPSSQTPSSQAPSTRVPSKQVPSTQVPSTQQPQRHFQGRAGKVARPDLQAPPVPAADLVDRRRSLNTI